jgi:hypothetical protein
MIQNLTTPHTKTNLPGTANQNSTHSWQLQQMQLAGTLPYLMEIGDLASQEPHDTSLCLAKLRIGNISSQQKSASHAIN